LVHGYDRDGTRIAAVDLRTGEQRTVRRMPDVRTVLVIASAEGLSVQARGIAF
jgi:hypothetical protein